MLKVGAVIGGNYQLERELGAGGMGSVWLATQLSIERPVAVKFLRSVLTGDPRLRARFENEAKALARLRHPNCITFFDYGYAEELQTHYLVMEYLPGRPLDDFVGMLPFPETLSIVRQVASALEHAHHHGILHRDLKPPNVMLVPTFLGPSLVKVLDFGLARVSATDGPKLTNTGEIFGTPEYMAPEQATGIDVREPADLYALGVLAYEMLSGRRPFDGRTAFEVVRKHVEEPPPLLNDDIPRPIQNIVFRLLEKKPAARFASATDLIHAIDAIEDAELHDARPRRVSSGVFIGRRDGAARALDELDQTRVGLRIEELGDAASDEATVVREAPAVSISHPASATTIGGPPRNRGLLIAFGIVALSALATLPLLIPGDDRETVEIAPGAVATEAEAVDTVAKAETVDDPTKQIVPQDELPREPISRGAAQAADVQPDAPTKKKETAKAENEPPKREQKKSSSRRPTPKQAPKREREPEPQTSPAEDDYVPKKLTL